jgi:ATP-dependent Lon protease
MSDSNHSMITRSKKVIDPNHPPVPEDDVDENGNIKELIDYECDEDFDQEMFQKELKRLGGRQVSPLHLSPKKKVKKHPKNKLPELFLSYMLMNLLNPPDKRVGRRRSKKKNLSLDNIMIDIIDEEENDSMEEEESDIELSSDEEDETELSEDSDSIGDEEGLEEELEEGEEGEDELEEEGEGEEEDGEESSDEESEIELDEYDEEYVDMEEDELSDEDADFNYFLTLEKGEKEQHLKDLKEIKNIRNTNVPLKFKILNSEMDMRTKSIAIGNIEKLSEMDVSTGEHCKMDKWINGLINIPFGTNIELPINNENTIEEKRDYLLTTQKQLDKAIFGHQEAKMHILQVIGKWVKNPQSQGNVLAIQGPMGNGKTTLVKEGIAKAINRPFAFIALGGASDSAFFDGHSYTYEGSHWGRIVDILIDSKCMNPIIYFDELDKISDTHKGEEIVHLLTHLTDPSQNTLFQDNYFPGIHLNLSKALFIFSFNDETKVDRILKDRMYVINTKGFNPKEKVNISRSYILPELLDTFLFSEEEILFSDAAILSIIEKYTGKEEGVRNLKRCLETIISKINIYYLSDKKNEKEENTEKIPMTFTIKDFKLPLNITEEIVKELLPGGSNSGNPPEHMYM